MNEENDNYYILKVGIVLLIFVLIFSNLSWMDAVRNLRKDAINLGYAEYNSTNGNWQWKTIEKK